MHRVHPSVHVIAQTEADDNGIRAALLKLGVSPSGALDWAQDHGGGSGETVIEFGGRLCYKSFEVGLNPNVTKIRDDSTKYIANILSSKHGSVLEHSSVSIAFLGVSRVFTHEVVRHRAGYAFSQESMRYVRLDNIGYRYPSIFEDQDFFHKLFNDLPHDPDMESEKYLRERTEKIFEQAFEQAEENVAELCRLYQIDKLKSFDVKKALTSAFRRLIPDGVTTNILVTGNHRAWRHVIETRTSIHAEEEVREVMALAADVLAAECPRLYQDMTKNEKGEYIFANSKV